MTFSPHIFGALGLPEGSALDAVEAALETLQPSFPNFFSDAGRQQLKELHVAVPGEEFDVFPLKVPCQDWRYLIVKFGVDQSAELLQVPIDPTASPPPTNGEKLLVRAWNALPEIIDGNGNLVTSRLLCAWQRQGLKGTSVAEALVSMFNGVGVRSIGLPSSTFDEASLVILPESYAAGATSDYKVKILSECLLESSIRWRFIGYYRIFEYEYLKNVIDKINKEFFGSPKDVVQDALSTLSSERDQLVDLIRSRGITAPFENIRDAFDAAVGGGNRFCNAIKRDLKEGKAPGKDPWSYGAGVFYKIRCSIVHAGSASVFFEKFDDAQEFLSAIMQFVEAAVCALLAITVSAESGEAAGETDGPAEGA